MDPKELMQEYLQAVNKLEWEVAGAILKIQVALLDYKDKAVNLRRQLEESAA